MNNISEIKHCSEFDRGIEVKDKDVKIILDKYILNLNYEKEGDKDKFIIYDENEEYSMGKIYLYHRILVNYVLSKGYKRVIIKTNYTNLDIETIKEFDCPINYPYEGIMCGEYCKECIKRKDCEEVKSGFLGDVAIGKIENDCQLLNTLNLISNKKKMLEETEKQLKDKLYERITENKNKLQLKELGVELSKKEINKDTMTYDEAKALDIANNETVTVKVGEIKKIMKKNKVLASKISFKSVPFRTELDISTVGTKLFS